ncbi:MAG: glycoside hydrolase family 2, partial [Bacteroidales bacterium]|nr:glycoside hydrolase family 2 [Bacteroidales bacterium]
MKLRTFLRNAVCCIALVACCAAVQAAGSPRAKVNFDANWRFSKGDFTNGQIKALDDRGWRLLDVPHDWAIEDDYDQNSPVLRGGGYLGGGIAWYRKSFTLDRSFKGKRIYVEFEGVQANSDVWINEHLLGHRPMGYLPLYYDITDYVNLDGKTPNVFA